MGGDPAVLEWAFAELQISAGNLQCSAQLMVDAADCLPALRMLITLKVAPALMCVPKMLDIAVRGDDVQRVELIVRLMPECAPNACARSRTRAAKSLMRDAIRAGSLSVLEWVWNRTRADIPPNGFHIKHILAPTGRGAADVIRWLLSHPEVRALEPSSPNYWLNSMCESGELGLVCQLDDALKPDDGARVSAMSAACARGQRHVAEWLNGRYQLLAPGASPAAQNSWHYWLCQAAGSGNLAMLAWMAQALDTMLPIFVPIGYPFWGEWHLDDRRIVEKGIDSMLYEASRLGRLDVVDWVLRLKPARGASPRDRRASLFAACAAGHRGVIERLLPVAGPLTLSHRDVMWAEVFRSNSEDATRALAGRVPCSDYIALNAACKGRKYMWALSYVIETRADEILEAVAIATSHNNIDALEWVRTKLAATAVMFSQVPETAARTDNLKMITWWHRSFGDARGGDVGAARAAAVENRSSNVLAWLDKHHPDPGHIPPRWLSSL